MSKSKKAKIKKCKCGKKPHLLIYTTGEHYIGCPRCKSFVSDFSVKKVIKRWNRFVKKGINWED